MSDKKPDPVCVVGMHRSGTSMVAGLLQRAGIYLGEPDELLGAEEGNQKGHFESLDVLDLDENLLKSLGGSWDHPPRIPEGWVEAEEREGLREWGRRVVEKLSARDPWGWKDPRTTVLLPYWRFLVPNLRFVICLRSPLEVALSLEKRDAIPVRRGSELWVRYVIDAIRETAGRPRLFLSYEGFLDDPQAATRELLDFCGIPGWQDGGALEESVALDLRHHQVDRETAVQQGEMSSRARMLYLGLLSLWPGRGLLPHVPTPSTNRALDELARIAEALVSEEEATELRSRITSSDQRLQDRTREIEEMEAERKDLEEDVDEALEALSSLRADNESLQDQLDRLEIDFATYRGAVEGSLFFRAFRVLARARDLLLPAGSRRRGWYERLRNRLKGARPSVDPETATPSVQVAGPEVPPVELPDLPEPLRIAASDPQRNDLPLVSVIVRTCGGRVGCLAEAIDSITRQTYPRLEIVVVEDGSGEAADFVKGLSLPPGMSLVYQELPKVGRCVSGTRGLELGSGAYLGFLDDDDLLYADHVMTLVRLLEAESEIAGAYGVAERVFTRVDSHTPFVYEEARRDVALRHEFDRQDLWIGNLFPIQAVLFRRELFEKYGGFDPRLDLLEDWDLWNRYTRSSEFRLVDRVTSMYRVPADPGVEAKRNESLDSFFPAFREMQGRFEVTLSRDELGSLLNSVLMERKYFRAARSFGWVELRQEMERSRVVREFFDPSRLDEEGRVVTTPREALDLTHRIVLESPKLSRLLRWAERVQQNGVLKGVADRCYGALEKVL